LSFDRENIERNSKNIFIVRREGCEFHEEIFKINDANNIRFGVKIFTAALETQRKIKN
jgi:hypothetical protein